MSDFNGGDRVKCISAISATGITEGMIYTVSYSYKGGDVSLIEVGGALYLKERFVLVETPKPPQPQPDSLVAAFTAVHDAIAPLSSLDRHKVIHAVKALLGMS